MEVGIRNEGLPQLLIDNWGDSGLKGFSAYILCPRIFDPNGQWSPEGVSKLLDYFIEEYNVDANNIVITGHSLGANSTAYLATQMSSYFSKAVVFSGGYVTSPSMPTLWYVGEYEVDYYRSAAQRYAAIAGEDKVCWVASGHTAMKPALLQDNGQFVRNGK